MQLCKIQIFNCAKYRFSTVQTTNMQVCSYAKYHDQERGKEHLCHPVGGRVVNHQVDEVKLPQEHCQHLNLTILEIPDLEKGFVASFVIFSTKDGFIIQSHPNARDPGMRIWKAIANATIRGE